MKLSARNQIMGKVVSVQRGQTTGHVRIDIGNGKRPMNSVRPFSFGRPLRGNNLLISSRILQWSLALSAF